MEKQMIMYGTLNPGVIFEYQGEQLMVSELENVFLDSEAGMNLSMYRSFYIFTGREFNPFESSERLYHLLVEVPPAAKIETGYETEGEVH